MLVAAAGCGRTELFGARKKCAPTDKACQMQIDGGVDVKPDVRPDGPDGRIDGGPDLKPGVDGGPDMKADRPPTCEQMREICDNGKDDNCNGLADCSDPGCLGDRACVKPGVEVCNNTLDDDDDKLIDCADPDCKTNIACRPIMGKEICDNGVDDNADKLVDCSDAQCTMFPACLEVACTSDVDFGTIAAHGDKQSRVLDTRGASRTFSTCATPGGVARVGRITLKETTDLRVDASQTAGAAHVVSLFRAGANQTCDRNPVGGACLALGAAPSATRTYPALEAGTYWLVVQSYPSTQGAVTIALSTGNPTRPEQCANGVDDDMNGLIDCQDAACRTDMNCVATSCMTDGNLGALVVDAPAKNATVDLTRAVEKFSPTCAGTTPGKAVALALTMPQAGGIEVAFRQSGGTVIALFEEPGPGVACDHVDNDHGCEPENIPAGALAFQGVAAGRYILILKAIGDQAGVINIRVRAFGNRNVEVCANGIDDDGDNLKDCDDPECFGVGMCGAPACMPERDLGPLSIGKMLSVDVDTRDAPDFYNAGCGRGDGPERVLRLNVTELMQVGVDCMGSGSHVISLARQLSPLDRCDRDTSKCADPDTLSFGCNYSMPGVQPGTYNLIVEAFRKGSEGVIHVDLTGIRQTVDDEVCDNGVDDDKDGFVDCMDRKCVTDAACAKFSCRPDEKLGIIPLDGSRTSVVINTSDAGDDQQQTPCVSASGGQDGVVSFEVPARANLKLEWAQSGTHSFALYRDLGNVYACTAGPLISCTSSAGQLVGSAPFTNLLKGKYHLVVDADQPGAESGVVIGLSGTAAP